MRVDRFGVHWAPGGIPFLMQASGAQNLISRDLPAPFEVRVRPRTLSCPHEIDLTSEAKADWTSDPLAQAMMPVPGFRIFMLHDPTGALDKTLQTLQRLSSATQPLMRPLWWKTPQDMTPLFGVTNLSPIVFFNASLDQAPLFTRNVDLARSYERTILCSTRQRFPTLGATWIETELGDVSKEPLEALGATTLKAYMSDPSVFSETSTG